MVLGVANSVDSRASRKPPVRQAKLPKLPSRPRRHSDRYPARHGHNPVSVPQFPNSDADDSLTHSPTSSEPTRHTTSARIMNAASANKKRKASASASVPTPTSASKKPRRNTAPSKSSKSARQKTTQGRRKKRKSQHTDDDSSPDEGLDAGSDAKSRDHLAFGGASQKVDCSSRAKHADTRHEQKQITYDATELPNELWKPICNSIAEPLTDPDTRPDDQRFAMMKLVQLARLGKLVYYPAMAALYKAPPITSQISFALLARTLQQPPSTTLINYQTKVKSLRINVDIFHRKYTGCYLSLEDIVPYLANLQDLELYHDADQPPYRELNSNIRQKHPPDLLQCFEPAFVGIGEETVKREPLKLRSWHWSSRLAGDSFDLENLKLVHQNPVFSDMKKVSFVNYQSPYENSSRPGNVMKNEAEAKKLAACVEVLPSLEHLVLEASTIVDAHLLLNLPKNLQNLELICCWKVSADILRTFLSSHGGSLRMLTLNHCLSLNMDFLGELGTSCPKLTHFAMNLQYFRRLESYHDEEPLYDSVLSDGVVPVWPRSVQSIDIAHMRFEDSEPAAVFLQSLVDSAPDMPDLRSLVLRAKLNIPIRERNDFRKSWEDKLVTVFKRRCELPQSLQAAMDKARNGPGPRSLRSAGPASANHASQLRIDTQPSSSQTGGQDSITPLTRDLAVLMNDYPAAKVVHDADDEDSEDELSLELPVRNRVTSAQRPGAAPRRQPMKKKKKDFVHGMCDVVDVEVDNQKTTERIYSMEDFLDEPDESESDWDGDDEVFD